MSGAKGGGKGGKGGKGDKGDDGGKGDKNWMDKAKEAQNWFEHIDETGDEELLGWLLNVEISSVTDEASAMQKQVVTCVFYGEDGRDFKGEYLFHPYLYVLPEEGAIDEVELGLKSQFREILADCQKVEREDLDLANHLSGIKAQLVKLSFFNTQQLNDCRKALEPFVKKNTSKQDSATYSVDDILREQRGGNASGSFTERIVGLREYDVKFHTRVAIDEKVYVGKWYYVKAKDGLLTLRMRDEGLPAVPRICAFDIETTKQPLKFPKPDEDQVYMISWMFDGQGYLIINREIVTEDIEDFEYTPKPDYKGEFKVFNVKDEEATLQKFIDLMKRQKPHVFVTYNGDFFDFPFLQRRMQEYKMSLFTSLGFKDAPGGEYLSPFVSHLDCMYWVNRDSYLPQGSRSLKAVSRAKLGYDPLEIDPEDMLPLAREDPQKMASYSVSDAVATYYLYMKYVHPFIFSLCTIIPMSPDEVLRKGSGTLCEQLLMVMAYEKNLVAPNKQVSPREQFWNGHLLDTDTYVGGHVEALQSGIFRADIPIDWKLDAAKYQELIDNVPNVMKFALETEMGVPISDVANYDEIIAKTVKSLEGLRDKPVRKEVPHILHLDVGAMYPNIILTNRLQPSSMVTEEDCSACCFNDPANECKRSMKWLWRGEYFVLDKSEYNRLKTQISTESIQTKNIADIAKKMAGKKAWKFAKKPLFEKKKPGGKKGGREVKGYEGGGTGYRKGNAGAGVEDALREQERQLLAAGGAAPVEEEDADGNGMSRYADLKDSEQDALLKKRVTDYCRKAYGKIHATKLQDKVSVVCQRENSFYVDTVKLFRDRRIEFKKRLKQWKGILEAVMEGEDTEHTIPECKGYLVLYESLQLAHKCILNSFYGYVMRKGSRWYSMEMAAAVTYCGASLIMMSRELVDLIGLSLELDTDGIWCCLPGSFPMDVVFMSNKGKKLKVSYPCAMLNKATEDGWKNLQYQDLKKDESGAVVEGSYEKRTECTIFFEVDGPYASMILPAAKEEGKGIKKRYAVFEFDGKLAELKGFELKRRGELQLIKDFQAQIFANKSMVLDGKSLDDAYGNIAKVANMCLDVLYTKGSELDDESLMDAISESTSMTRRLIDYPKDQKSLAATTARRLADFLGDDMTKDSGLKCTFVIAKKPDGKSVTERPVPVQIFQAERHVRLHWMRKWLEDPTLGVDGDIDIRDILDWDYYITRLSGNILKIIVIPAALQKVKNPVPRIPYPDWLRRMVAERDSGLKQTTLTGLVVRTPRVKQPAEASGVQDMEDFGKPLSQPQSQARKRTAAEADDGPDSAAAAAPPPPSRQFSKTYLANDYDAPGGANALCQAWSDGFFKDQGFSRFLTHAKYTWKSARRGQAERGGAATRQPEQRMV